MNNTDNMLLKKKRSIWVLKIVTLSVSITLLLTSCIPQTIDNGIRKTPAPSISPKSTLQPIATPTDPTQATQAIDNGIVQTPIPSIAPVPTRQPIVASTAPTQITPPILSENTSHGNELFAPIIDAYAALERSGYTTFDKDIIGDSLLIVNGGRSYNFGDKPTLTYAFYDINGDGSPELLIGADKSISGIYVLKNANPVSVIQVESRDYLGLLMDSDGKCVIEDSHGHMGYATEFFYTIDEDGKLKTLNKLYTNGDVKKDGELIGHHRAKDVLGKEVSITEEEYCSLIRKYGSTGYEPFEDTGKGRMIDVIWKPVATYN
ncbi:MAG TPA: hypothetical protein VF941_16470 [Clostridia bacterium]